MEVADKTYSEEPIPAKEGTKTFKNEFDNKVIPQLANENTYRDW